MLHGVTSRATLSCREAPKYSLDCQCFHKAATCTRSHHGASARSRGHTLSQRKLARNNWRSRISVTAPAAGSQAALSSSGLYKKLDEALEQPGDEGELAALEVVKELQNNGIMRGLGAGQGVPKRIYTLEELRLNRIEPEKLLSPDDKSLNFVRSVAQVAAAAGLGAWALLGHADFGQLGSAVLGLTFLSVLDQIVNQGGGEALILDTLGRLLVRTYPRRVALHESGHFLVAYLLGLLPRTYTLSTLDAFHRFGALNVQAGTRFCDKAFAAEAATGRMSSSSLDRYTCVALAGVVTEYLRFGQSEGGLGDVSQLDQLLRSLQFSQLKADGQVRWAVLNVAHILRNHTEVQDQLAEAMGRGESVGSCIQIIERQLALQSADA